MAPSAHKRCSPPNHPHCSLTSPSICLATGIRIFQEVSATSFLLQLLKVGGQETRSLLERVFVLLLAKLRIDYWL